jgi:HEPN domain-containing protein
VNTLKEDIRYPQKGDKFFIDNGSPDEISILHKTFQDFGSYADGYQTGAINLIDSALNNSDLRDYNIYPAIFLIRHYIELRLKELILGINLCNGLTNEYPKSHDIQKLWRDFKTAYLSIGEDITDPRFDVIGELIEEMASVDPISMSFRYPVDKNGMKIQKLKTINLTNLRETFIRLGFVFDGVAMQIANYVEITEDIMRDVYQNYW